MELKSIEQEAEDCRKAFEGYEVGCYVLHLHHEIIGETLSEPIENRIQYILKSKPEGERALRLRLMRPVPKKELKAEAKWQKAEAKLRQAYAKWWQAEAEWWKADAKWWKADAKWWKADAKLRQAEAEWRQAYAEWWKADAKLRQAEAEWRQAEAILGQLIHAKCCTPGCPWNGKTIFG